MKKKNISSRINQILGFSSGNEIDFTPMRVADLQKLLNVLENKPGQRAPLEISVKTERKPFLERRPVRDLLREVLSRA